MNYRSLVEGKLDARELANGRPALGDQTLLIDLQIEEVHRVIDGLHLAHATEPGLEVLRGIAQKTLAQIQRLVQHCLELLEACHHAEAHLASLASRLRTRVDGRLKATTKKKYTLAI